MSTIGQFASGVVGGITGFFIGGPVGAFYGFGIGLMVGGVLFPASADVEPPKSGDLQIQTSQYGISIPVIYGSRKVAGNLIWYGNFQTHQHEEEVGGKGGGGATSVSYTYSVSLAFGLCMGTRSVGNAWVGKDPLASSKYRIYDGTQITPDSHIQAILTAEGKTRFPVWKNLCYVVLENYDLGNSPYIPQFTWEICKGCPPVTIGYTTQQMAVSTQQTLTVVGVVAGCTYDWAIASGGGSLSSGTGTSVVYTAPATNAECALNPTITLSSGAVQYDVLQIAVNAVTTACAKAVLDACVKQRTGLPQYWICCYVHINCNGEFLQAAQCANPAIFCNYTTCHPGEDDLSGYSTQSTDYEWVLGQCGGHTSGQTDVRTPVLKTQGCCPEQLL